MDVNSLIGILCYEPDSSKVKMLLSYSSIIKKVVKLLPSDLVVFQRLETYFSSYKETPKEHTALVLEDYFSPDFEVSFQDTNTAYVLDKLGEYILYNEEVALVKDVLQQLETGASSADDVLGLLKSFKPSVIPSGSTAVEISLELVENSIADLKERLTLSFSSGIAALDDIKMTGLRPERGRLGCMLGWTKTGKTFYLNKMALENLKLNNKVLYISLEGGLSPLIQRLVSLSSGLPNIPTSYRRIKVPTPIDWGATKLTTITRSKGLMDLTPVEIKSVYETFHTSNFRLMRFPSRSVSFDQLRNHVLRVFDSGFHADLILLDSMYLLKMESGKKTHEVLPITTSQFSGLMSELNTAGETVHQVSTAYQRDPKSLIDENDIGLAKAICQDIDRLTTWTLSDFEKRIGIGRLYVPISRNGESGFVIANQFDFHVGDFSIASTLLDGIDVYNDGLLEGI